MLGCVGVAPARKEAIATATPGAFGGNMDYAGVTAGVKVMLPVNEPGALLFIGDGHARQGEGEVVGTGLETSMDVEFTVDLIKKKAVGWPRMETDTHMMVLGSARPLLQALQHATTEMQRWLMADYGFSERGASTLHGPGARIRDRQRRRSELHRRGEGAQGAAAAAMSYEFRVACELHSADRLRAALGRWPRRAGADRGQAGHHLADRDVHAARTGSRTACACCSSMAPCPTTPWRCPCC